MSKPEKNESHLEKELARELSDEDLIGTHADYTAKQASVDIGRKLGFSDKELEDSLGINLGSKDNYPETEDN